MNIHANDSASGRIYRLYSFPAPVIDPRLRGFTPCVFDTMGCLAATDSSAKARG
jgi:hypothetical protein